MFLKAFKHSHSANPTSGAARALLQSLPPRNLGRRDGLGKVEVLNLRLTSGLALRSLHLVLLWRCLASQQSLCALRRHLRQSLLLCRYSESLDARDWRECIVLKYRKSAERCPQRGWQGIGEASEADSALGDDWGLGRSARDVPLAIRRRRSRKLQRRANALNRSGDSLRLRVAISRRSGGPGDLGAQLEDRLAIQAAERAGGGELLLLPDCLPLHRSFDLGATMKRAGRRDDEGIGGKPSCDDA